MDFQIGDVVNVLRACRLPKVKAVIHTGVIDRIEQQPSVTLYWIRGLAVARTKPVLRMARRVARDLEQIPDFTGE